MEFLIISIKTCDGRRGSAQQWLEKINGYEKPESSLFNNLKSFFCTAPNDPKLNYISNDAQHPQEQDVYLKIFKYFSLMRIRMKISYMALIKKCTVRELFLQSICKTFKYLQKTGAINYKFVEHDVKTFSKMLHGKANVKLIAW